MRTVEEHQAVVRGLLAPLPIEDVPLGAAAGRVLAADLPALVSLPGFTNSAMDGYAARHAEVGTAGEATPVRLRVAADIPAGRSDVPVLEPGTVHRIMTGAPLPAGADVVVPVERTDGATDVVTITGSPAVGAHLRHTGEDIRAGEIALRAGTPLGAAQLGLAAAVGHAVLPVRRRPRVLVLSTGSELVEPGRPLLPGQIYESNSVLLATAVEAAGGEARTLHFVPDDVEQFLTAVRAELADADLLVTSGGVSAGAYEVVKDAFRELGTVEFGKVAMQPGGPQGAGTVDGVPVVTLPGNPVSSFVSFEVFVRPALRRALGHSDPDRLRTTARLTTPLRSPAGRRQFLRGRFDAGSVSQVGGPGSHLVAHLARANCLVVIPEDVTELPTGAEVTVVLIEGALQ
ncbi:molybdopterin molybdotransferase MoeA [Modestobacter roseus]|uniref:Molybdopterin molybdenumtransferase n=1 Tax=Modestobacter roseus TaxID=1181884 RepID=A0A562ITI9_9ACTN|nr:gephyrin-like molybdotransferase Glp [Modestobacter roseus]MQA33713.1 molybdopterin molybdenumtransferase MoeA [Modestobacter roseus]TWH74337.1 molybdopterin molybdochelatase [Modestobacter roseus]